jgi:aldose sugar dehydrogenase
MPMCRIRVLILSSLVLICILFLAENNNGYRVHATNSKDCTKDPCKQPIVNDDKLKVEAIAFGLKFPTTMAFLGDNDILVLERYNGTVRRILDNTLQPEPLLDVNITGEGERGMLGIAISNNRSSTSDRPFVFLYYTEAKFRDGGEAVGNRLYRYEYFNNQLVNPKLLLDLPAYPGPYHNGGAITIGPDGNVYVTVGDLGVWTTHAVNWKGTDTEKDHPANGSAGILRVTTEGNPVDHGLIGNSYPLNLYYAYGIRNSFGIDFDPVTGKLWDTENGPDYGDEINLVEPGFNSGWNTVQGFWIRKNASLGEFVFSTGQKLDLIDFGGKGKYSEPEFACRDTIGFTKPIFLESEKYGDEYKDFVYVGVGHNGNIYHFRLEDDRSSLSPVDENKQFDKIVFCKKDLKPFATGFGAVTDIEAGPDGYLYVVSYLQGIIYRIVPVSVQ